MRLHTILAVPLLLFGSAIHADAIDDLPDFGDASAAVISPTEEKRIGEEFMRDARKHMDIVDEPVLTAYIQKLGQRLVNHSDQIKQKFTFFVIRDSSINAFAVPGGYVGVNTGLIQASDTESELASVLAHEITHVTQKHIPRLLAQQKQLQGPATAALLAAMILGGQAGAAAYTLTAATVVDRQLSFTRDFEREADRLGIRLLNKSGFDPNAMPAFFEALQKNTRVYAGSAPEFLLTHPVTTARIAESRSRAAGFPFHQVPDSKDFHYARARVRVMNTNDPADAIRYFSQQLKNQSYVYREAAQYGLALAQLAAKKTAKALGTADQLIEEHPDDWRFPALKAEIYASTGQYRQAIHYYQAARQLDDNAVLSRYLAEAYLEASHLAEARKLLRKLLRRDNSNPDLHKMLARAEGGLGNQFDAQRETAEYYYLIGDSDQALAHLKLAKKQAGNSHYRLASVEARIEEVKDKIQIEKDEKR